MKKSRRKRYDGWVLVWNDDEGVLFSSTFFETRSAPNG